MGDGIHSCWFGSTQDNAENQQAVLAAGAIEPLVQLLRHTAGGGGGHVSRVAEHAAGALWSLACAEFESYRDRLVMPFLAAVV